MRCLMCEKGFDAEFLATGHRRLSSRSNLDRQRGSRSGNYRGGKGKHIGHREDERISRQPIAEEHYCVPLAEQG